MTKGSVAQANANMAKYLKEKGIRRTTCNCPICHRQVGLQGLESHIRICKGR